MREDIVGKFVVKRHSLPGILYIPASAKGSYVPGISRLVRKAYNVVKSVSFGLSIPFAVGREVLAYFWRGSPDISVKDPDKQTPKTRRRDIRDTLIPPEEIGVAAYFKRGLEGFIRQVRQDCGAYRII